MPGSHVLFFLCEVQLGTLNENYKKIGNMAFSWRDAGIVRDDFKGVSMVSALGYLHIQWSECNCD